MKINYDREIDALYIEFSRDKSFKTIEKGGNILVDLNKAGNVIGVEVLNYVKSASKKLNRLSVAVGKKIISIPA